MTSPPGRPRSQPHGYPTAADDFLLRGDLGGHGAPDGHMTGNQADKWPGKYFTPAVRRVAEEWPEEHGEIIGATPYSLRRGMISLRIRAGEDRQAIAKQCGTSVEMLERNYSFAIEDLEDEGPKPAEEERAPCPDSSLRPAGVDSCGLRERRARARHRESCHAARTSATLARSSGRPRFCSPRAARNRPAEAGKIQEIPANAVVAQLVEHFTRNEGVVGSSPTEGFAFLAAQSHLSVSGVDVRDVFVPSISRPRAQEGLGLGGDCLQ